MSEDKTESKREIQFVALSVGVTNRNGDCFAEGAMQKAAASLVGQPLRVRYNRAEYEITHVERVGDEMRATAKKKKIITTDE